MVQLLDTASLSHLSFKPTSSYNLQYTSTRTRLLPSLRTEWLSRRLKREGQGRENGFFVMTGSDRQLEWRRSYQITVPYISIRVGIHTKYQCKLLLRKPSTCFDSLACHVSRVVKNPSTLIHLRPPPFRIETLILIPVQNGCYSTSCA